MGKKKEEVNKSKDTADKKEKDDHKSKEKVWHEAASPDGQSYYWNVETGGEWYQPTGIQ